MRLEQIEKSYLYEGLDRNNIESVMLWESAGKQITEAALTADQIKQLFQQIEQGATASGNNRTMIGKGKDTAAAVNKAWEDLKTKIQDSGPVKNFDQKVSDALGKIGMGAKDPEFNGKVSSWVEKYRKFAKEHPIAQGAIYATLIALAGITGAGVGGAAALGLLKMADKLLQGERFSSAAYSGVKTGVTAFAASKLGDLIKGVKPGEQVPPPKPGSATFVKRDFDNYDYYLHPSNDSVVRVAKGSGSPFMPGNANYAGREAMKAAMSQGAQAQGLDAAGNVATSSAQAGSSAASSSASAAAQATAKSSLGNIIGDADIATRAGRQAAKAAIGDALSSGQISQAQAIAMAKQVGQGAFKAARGESVAYVGTQLSEGQVYMIFNRVSREELVEGPLDFVKGAVTKGKEKLQQVGKNITTKVTADKLNSAWQKAGAPTDTDELAKFLQSQGVSGEIVGKVYTDMKLPAPGQGAAMAKADSVKDMIAKLPTDRKVRLIKYMTSQLKVA